jgi:hypothetical protein
VSADGSSPPGMAIMRPWRSSIWNGIGASTPSRSAKDTDLLDRRVCELLQLARPELDVLVTPRDRPAPAERRRRFDRVRGGRRGHRDERRDGRGDQLPSTAVSVGAFKARRHASSISGSSI